MANKATAVDKNLPATAQSAGTQFPAKPSQALPVSNDMLDAMRESGTGLENVTTRDLIIPRLTILQGLSPQVAQNKPEYDPEARVGMIYDVGLREGFPDGVQFLPVHYVRQWLEWAPRNTGRGLQKIHDSEKILDETTLNDRRVPVLKNGNLIIETAQFYGFNITANTRASFLPMSSTQLKKARYLISLANGEKVEVPSENGEIQEITPPLYYRVYNFTTVPESNPEGNWVGWKIERGPTLEMHPDWRNILVQVKKFRKSVSTGEVRGDLSETHIDGTVNRTDPNAPM